MKLPDLLLAAAASSLLAACCSTGNPQGARHISSYYAQKGEQMSATMQPADSLNTKPAPKPTPRYKKLDLLQ